MQVWLCKEIKTGKIVALKKLKKAEMVKRGQIDHVKAERDVLAGIHNPFIVRLYYSFQVGCPSEHAALLACFSQADESTWWWLHRCRCRSPIGTAAALSHSH